MPTPATTENIVSVINVPDGRIELTQSMVDEINSGILKSSIIYRKNS